MPMTKKWRGAIQSVIWCVVIGFPCYLFFLELIPLGTYVTVAIIISIVVLRVMKRVSKKWRIAIGIIWFGFLAVLFLNPISLVVIPFTIKTAQMEVITLRKPKVYMHVGETLALCCQSYPSVHSFLEKDNWDVNSFSYDWVPEGKNVASGKGHGQVKGNSAYLEMGGGFYHYGYRLVLDADVSTAATNVWNLYQYSIEGAKRRLLWTFHTDATRHFTSDELLQHPELRIEKKERDAPALSSFPVLVSAPLILFDGASLDRWQKADGSPAHWKLADGAMEATHGGDLYTKEAFGDCQLHVEWQTPKDVDPNIMNRGNSGVILMGRYEVQVLDSNPDTIYADGIAGSFYGQNPPLVNACSAPGEWQTFDIIFRAPRWEGDALLRQGVVTVFHNGVLVQDHWPIEGSTDHLTRAQQRPHADKLPLVLQSHASPVRYRNIWLRELTPVPPPHDEEQ
ncbi:MAG: DUF1080 domain-containing protein [Kiritimatiellaeota bacterium]|nr:DUF1080 domain-containing protein [Kiritimatiellota bacterium]